MAPNGYAPIEQPARLIRAHEVSAMFGHRPKWFSSPDVRRRLYERGFPLPVERGRWLRTAVEAWLERVGNQRAMPSGNKPHYYS